MLSKRLLLLVSIRVDILNLYFALIERGCRSFLRIKEYVLVYIFCCYLHLPLLDVWNRVLCISFFIDPTRLFQLQSLNI